MPIDGINHGAKPGPVLFAAKPQHGSGGNGKIASFPENDNVQISERSQEFLRIQQLVNAQPDVRLDRVNKLAKAIDSGTYSIKAEHIADAIIQKNLIDLNG